MPGSALLLASPSLAQPPESKRSPHHGVQGQGMNTSLGSVNLAPATVGAIDPVAGRRGGMGTGLDGRLPTAGGARLGCAPHFQAPSSVPMLSAQVPALLFAPCSGGWRHHLRAVASALVRQAWAAHHHPAPHRWASGRCGDAWEE